MEIGKKIYFKDEAYTDQLGIIIGMIKSSAMIILKVQAPNGKVYTVRKINYMD